MKNARVMHLEYYIDECRKKILRLNEWLLRNHGHPDRCKIYNDIAYYTIEIDRSKRKVTNINTGLPELGVDIDNMGASRIGNNKPKHKE